MQDTERLVSEAVTRSVMASGLAFWSILFSLAAIVVASIALVVSTM